MQRKNEMKKYAFIVNLQTNTNNCQQSPNEEGMEMASLQFLQSQEATMEKGLLVQTQ